MQTMLSFPINTWHPELNSQEHKQAIETLEQGKILFFPELAFALNENEKHFLNPKYLAPKSKNITYNIRSKYLGRAAGSEPELKGLEEMLHRFAQASCELIESVLPEYKGKFVQGRTSFRPAPVSNRKTSYRKDDRLLHVDAFPSTPTHGLRILRVFSNINPNGEPRVWHVGESFSEVVKKFISQTPKPFPGKHTLMKLLKLTKTKRSIYDHYMMNLHNRMKADLSYQQKAIQERLELPANSTWIVYTDQVSHAALAGQFMLEQTFYLPVEAMHEPANSPLRILEKVVGQALV